MDEKKSTRLRRLTAVCLGVVFLLEGVSAIFYGCISRTKL